MTDNKRLYKLISKENDCTIGWFTDSEDMFHLIDWYDIDTKYEVYKLEKVVE